jgi:uncharacterized caspase-like protein/thiol-disulfide isomerase/thioredoxin
VTTSRGTVGRAREAVKPSGGRRFGVVVGIDRYRDARLNLRHAGADAQALYELMVDPECGLFAPDDVRLLRSEEATKEAIWRALSDVRRKSGPDDDVWIFYAGHAAPEGDGVYWVAHDSDVDDLYGTGVSQLQISDVLSKIQAKRVLTLLDCCHAAATAAQNNRSRHVMGERDLFKAFEGQGRVTLAASSGSQRSVELGEFGHGAFTHYLVEGMRGEADLDGDGVVTADELWIYLNGKVRDAARKAGNEQTPVRTGEATHQFAISLNPKLSAQRRRQREQIDQLIGLGQDQLSTDEAQFLLSVVESGGAGEHRALLEDLEDVVLGRLPVPRFRRLLAAARLQAAPSAEDERRAEEEARSAEEAARKVERAYAAAALAKAEAEANAHRVSTGAAGAGDRSEATTGGQPHSEVTHDASSGAAGAGLGGATAPLDVGPSSDPVSEWQAGRRWSQRAWVLLALSGIGLAAVGVMGFPASEVRVEEVPVVTPEPGPTPTPTPAPMAPPEPPASASEEASLELYKSASDDYRAGDGATALEKLTALQAQYPGTRAARAGERLMAELTVVGRTAPAIDAEKWLQGRAALTDQGMTLLVFFEVWCPHCKRELPKLQPLADRWRSQGLQVIGSTTLSRGKTEADGLAFLRELNVTFPVFKERERSMSDAYGVSGVPAAAIVRVGKVVWRGHPAQLTDELISTLKSR